MSVNGGFRSNQRITGALRSLSRDAQDFWVPYGGRVRRIPPPDPLTFYREFISKSIPVIITGGMDDWPARTKWEWQYWEEEPSVASATVTVDVTPSGHGDCVVLPDAMEGNEAEKALFVKPEEREMSMKHFMEFFHRGDGSDGVPYLSHQNDSLREELPMLETDIPPAVEFAKQAFGNSPEAVNLWIGDERAVSSVHKDHYENMYCVVKGRKHFTLLPPCDTAFLPESEYVSARYHQVKQNEGSDLSKESITLKEHPSWTIVVDRDEQKTPWIAIDPAQPDMESFPSFKFASSIECTVEEGEILYLPSMWYHRVTQKCATISVNYWY